MPSPAAHRSKIHPTTSKSSARPTSGRTGPPVSKVAQRPIQKPSKQITRGPQRVVHSDDENHDNRRDRQPIPSSHRGPPVTPPETSDVEQTDTEELETDTPAPKTSKRKVENRKAQEPPAKKSKRATSNDEDEDEDEDGDEDDKKRAAVRRICRRLGRYYPRAVHLWAEADDVVWAGIEHANKAEMQKVPSHEFPCVTPNEKTFSILCGLVEREITFLEAFGRFETRQEAAEVMIREFQLGFGEGCASDTHKVWTSILDLCLEDRRHDTLEKPIPATKTDQGFNHYDTGRLLCPQRFCDKFDEEFLNKIVDGQVKITASDWPSFLYCQEEFVVGDPESGLMKGYLLLRVFLHIFFSNGDPIKQGGPKRRGIAKLHGMRKVTGCHIAYAACQARYALSSKDTWARTDGAFHMDVFYDVIVDLFEKYPDDEWVTTTLAWWNEEVFGDPDGCPEDSSTRKDLHPSDSSVQTVADAREARAKARAEAAAAALLASADDAEEEDVDD
ncbi:uncharacterized protein ARMOST_14540 [Armillaria ostoyae]|uniref:Uncharacterized protein n=1 Tax=Armillaria ostoyae TaxID=47428 RepID=A0A284RQU2_ARMOS|nr:uncharacterized protein ARMOST_14540 [Armillaria ostoyae]